MSGRSVVLKVTPALAKQLPKGLRVVITADATVSGKPGRKPAAKEEKTEKKRGRPKGSKNKTTEKKASKKEAKEPKAKKVAKTKAINPEVVVQFVRANSGCNMTDIEKSVKMPQADIRKALNVARESGEIRTEGQRRGLRYFPNGGGSSPQPAKAAVAEAEETDEEDEEEPSSF